MADRLLLRRDTSVNWATNNPILGSAEPGYETDTKKLKFGDGTTAWLSLPYFGGGSTSVDWDDITDKPTSFPPSNHTHLPSEILQDNNNNFVTNTEKLFWNNKLGPSDPLDGGDW